MHKLNINVAYRVNKEQYKHIKGKYRDYAAHKVVGGKYYIKFLTFATISSKQVLKELKELELFKL